MEVVRCSCGDGQDETILHTRRRTTVTTSAEIRLRYPLLLLLLDHQHLMERQEHAQRPAGTYGTLRLHSASAEQVFRLTGVRVLCGRPKLPFLPIAVITFYTVAARKSFVLLTLP